ncbi:MAG TPA: Gfo/Idh/MocA family oxidoreductase [Bacteroidia bacterium]|nr:Gfo/Idh/MocA family oxidoreductase [Bacteroidia bacterium]
MLKFGVFGAGHLGKIHIRLLKEIQEVSLTGFYDVSPETRQQVASEFGINAFNSPEELIDASDVVDIVTPTLAHFECAAAAIKRSKHVFIEKPLANTVAEGEELMQLAGEANIKVQVGHVERFNPAFIAARPYIGTPMFIETHRLAQFNPRGTDVSVVLDLMIHDIDVVLSLVRSPVRKISTSGVAVVSDSPDIANARIEFDNGCVANLTASRISMKNMRKSRFFQRDAYISVDFLKKSAEVIRLRNVTGTPDPLAVTIDLGPGKGTKQIFFENPAVSDTNAIREELISFAKAIETNTDPIVDIRDGFMALEVAHKIADKLSTTATVSL